MKLFGWLKASCVSTLLISAGPAQLLAQQFEAGVIGGGSIYFNNSITGPRGSGDAGFKPGFTLGGWIGHNLSGHFSGEARYLFGYNSLKASSNGNEVTFAGQSHTITYDFLIHANSREDRFRPYAVVGAGFKGYRGTGTEQAFQALSNIAVLTKTSEWKPVVDFGAGVKWALSSRLMLRAEVRDYLTPFPKNVILPGPGAKVSGWAHDLTPLVGLSYLW